VNAADQIIFTMNLAQQIYLWESLNNNKPVLLWLSLLNSCFLFFFHSHQHTTKYSK